MFKWYYKETVITDATAQQIWKIWSDPESWSQWDSELEWVKMDKPFKEGAIGEMKPVGGPKVKFVLTSVKENHEFCDKAKLPLTTLEFTHLYEMANNNQAQIVHEVHMKGLLAPLFGLVIGRKIRAHLREAMLELSKLAQHIQIENSLGRSTKKTINKGSR